MVGGGRNPDRLLAARRNQRGGKDDEKPGLPFPLESG
jgi:hypothetical protein